MSITELQSEPEAKTFRASTIDMRLEVVVIPVSDVDRAKRFYGAIFDFDMPEMTMLAVDSGLVCPASAAVRSLDVDPWGDTIPPPYDSDAWWRGDPQYSALGAP